MVGRIKVENIYKSSDYRRSRKAYAAQCTFEYFVTLLVADAFLANLLTYIGISDALTGVIASFISLAFLFQLLSIFIVGKINNPKKTVILCNCLSQFLFMCLYIVPFIPISKEIKTVLVIAFIMVAYIFNYMVSGVLFKWANSFVNPVRRAEFSAIKEMISLISGIVFTLVVGHIIDHFTALGETEKGFVFIASAMLILNICNFVSLILINKDSAAMKKERDLESDVSLREVIVHTLGNKNFISVIIMTSMWYAARYMTVGFMGTFKTKDLLISVGIVQIINIAGNIARLIVTRPFGRFSDKTSYATGLKWAFIIEAAAFAINMFATPKTWWCVIAYTVLYNISLAGSNQNSFNITYSYVDSKYIVQAMAIKNSIGGVCGFLISLLASRVLHFIQANGNMIFGIPIYGQQLLSLFSIIILVAAVLYIKFVIEKQKIKIQ